MTGTGFPETYLSGWARKACAQCCEQNQYVFPWCSTLPAAVAGSTVMPQTGSRATRAKLLDDQQRLRGEVQHLGRGRAEQRLAELAHAAAAHADEVALRLGRLLDDGFGDRPDQHARLVGDAGGIELLLRRGEVRLALFLVVLRELVLAHRAHPRHRQVNGDQLDFGLGAVLPRVLDEEVDGVKRRLRAVHGEKDFHAAILRGPGLGRLRPRREAHGKGAALGDLALDRDRAAVLLDDLARAGEADAGALEAALDVGAALEALEDPPLVGAGNADAAIAH